MALAFVDSPNRYTVGNCADTTMSGVWLSVPSSLTPEKFQVDEPSFGGFGGTKAWKMIADPNAQDIRYSLAGGAVSEIFMCIPLYFPDLPIGAGRRRIEFRSDANALICYVSIEPTGTMALYNSAGTQIAVTPAPVIVAASWTYFEMRLLTGAGSAIWQMRDAAGNVIANFSGLTFAGTIGIIAHRVVYNVAEQLGTYYFGEPIVKNTTGTKQNTWYANGGVKVYRMVANADDPASDWSFTGRRMFGPGVGQMIGATPNAGPDTNSGWRTADAAALELGSGDYTIEGTFRWNGLPGTAATQYLASKWFPSAAVSWGLKLYENGGAYYLSLEIDTDGTSGAQVVVHDFPFTPNVYQPYAIAISRNAGVNRLYIDGVRQGPAVADANTYANTSAQLVVGARQAGATSLADPFNGWIDEFRYTVGVGRYPTEYTPATSAFPRSASDPSWGNVQLLMGWDTSSVDDSQFGRVITQNGDATQLTTDDGLFGYQSIDKPGRDDTFVQAALIAASGTLEFIANATNGTTCVIGSKTYTFKTVLAVADDVFIGVDADTTIDNLIAAVNAASGAGTKYGTGTTANADASATALPGAIVSVEALVPGTAGNSLAFTTTVVSAVISGAGTLTGGEDIPGPGIYKLERVPRGVTRIEAIGLFTRRSVYGPGSAQLTPSLIDSSLAASSGVNAAAPTNPGWQVDLFSSNGGNNWTTADLIDAKLQLDRTA